MYNAVILELRAKLRAAQTEESDAPPIWWGRGDFECLQNRRTYSIADYK
jgi:hypothetical protein